VSCILLRAQRPCTLHGDELGGLWVPPSPTRDCCITQHIHYGTQWTVMDCRSQVGADCSQPPHHSASLSKGQRTALHDCMTGKHTLPALLVLGAEAECRCYGCCMCCQDPHFKVANHRRRIIQPSLLTEYAHIMAPGGWVYTITDVPELGEWMVRNSCR